MAKQKAIFWLAAGLVVLNLAIAIVFMTRPGEPAASKGQGPAAGPEVGAATNAILNAAGRAETGTVVSTGAQSRSTGSAVYSVRVPSFDERFFPQPVLDFRRWMERFLLAGTLEQRDALAREGETMARKRRDAMTDLIKTNPRRALELAIAPEERQRLPDAIRQHIEQWVKGRGVFGVLVVDYFKEGKSETRREVVLDGKRYAAYVYGRRLQQSTQQDAPLQGIVLGELMAVREEPPQLD